MGKTKDPTEDAPEEREQLSPGEVRRGPPIGPRSATDTAERLTVCESASWLRSKEGTMTLLTLSGDLDFGCAGPFAAHLARLANDHSDLIVDMSRVEFIDSAVVDAIDRVSRLFELLGLVFALRAPSRPVRHLLELGELDRLTEQPGVPAAPMFGPARPAQAGLGTRVMFGP
jgi:anti-anti-sigma factor